MLYLLTAGKKALIDGGITEEVMRELDKKRCGVLIGSALGGMSVKTKAIPYYIVHITVLLPKLLIYFPCILFDLIRLLLMH